MQLLSIYIRLASAGIIIIAYELNCNFLWYKENLQNYSLIKHVLFETEIYALQISLALLFSLTNSIKTPPQGATVLLFLVPSLAQTLSLPQEIKKILPALTALGCTLLLAYSMWIHGLRVCETIYKGITWCHNVVENYGLYTMIETHWINLHIPQVFRAFWLIRLAEYSIYAVSNDFSSLTVTDFLKGIVIHGSENIVALLGMASIISLLSQQIGYAIQKFLQLSDPSERNIGNVSAVLFLLLSLQTGVTNLTPAERYKKITCNLWLLYTAFLHFTFNILNPLLLSLSTSRNPSLSKHIRSLAVTLFLIISPIIILTYQWQNAPPNTWLFALTSFMIELIIKASALITVYILFVIDTYKDGLWENLDDYIYYLKAVSSLTEFILGIYLLINGFWIFMFESTGAIRACMMCLHAYFNIWIEGKRGWESFLQRQSAEEKINFLQEATKEQLKQNNDVCTICFQSMKSARITKCKHFFHAVCLRKWLNVQDICPLCQTVLCSKSDKKSDWANAQLT